MIKEYFEKKFRSLRLKFDLLFARTIIVFSDDSKKFQTSQIKGLEGESKDEVERLQNYGFTSHPPAGSEALTIFMGGDRSHGLTIAVDNRKFRLKNLKEGEVAIFTDEGDSIILKRNNKIEINTKEATVNAEDKAIISTKDAQVNASTKASIVSPTTTIDSQNTNVTGNLNVAGLVACSGLGAGGPAVAGKVADSKGSMDDIRATYNTHTHNSGPSPDQGMS